MQWERSWREKTEIEAVLQVKTKLHLEKCQDSKNGLRFMNKLEWEHWKTEGDSSL